MIGPMDEIGSERAPMGKAMDVHGLIESTVVIAKAAYVAGAFGPPPNKKTNTEHKAMHMKL